MGELTDGEKKSEYSFCAFQVFCVVLELKCNGAFLFCQWFHTTSTDLQGAVMYQDWPVNVGKKKTSIK